MQAFSLQALVSSVPRVQVSHPVLVSSTRKIISSHWKVTQVLTHLHLSSPAPDLPGVPSVFIFPPKPKEVLLMTYTPKITCVVVDVSQDDPEIEFSWFMNNVKMSSAQTQSKEEQTNGTVRVVSSISIAHKDWLNGNEFKCKANSRALPAPIERTISKDKGWSCGATEAGCDGHADKAQCRQFSTLAMTSAPTPYSTG